MAKTSVRPARNLPGITRIIERQEDGNEVFRATAKLGQTQSDLLNLEHAASVSMDVRKLIKGHSS